MPGDKYEVEADRVADRVVDGKSAGTLASGISSLGQRKEEDQPQAKAVERPGRPGELEQEVPQAKMDDQAPEEPVQAAEEEMPQAKAEEEDIQAKTEDEEPQAKAEEEAPQAKAETEEPQAKAEEDEFQAKAEMEEPQAKAEMDEPQAKKEEEVQARSSGGAGLSPSADMARQIRASRGRGNPLPGPVRQKMEAQFGANLSGVRIHTDAPAVLLAQQLKAQAFTQRQRHLLRRRQVRSRVA